MKKIVLSFLFSLFYFQLYASIPVENIFVDIDKNYKYYRELQELFDRGMVFPDAEGKLNPLKLLNRDEFVGISTEVTCKKCISPNVDLEYIERYMGNQKYFDVDENNKYYYCISEADALDQVKGYDVGQKCENGTFKEGERAFCPLNVITKEEAYAVILRNSKLWTIEQNKDLIDRIYSGENFENLSDDVGSKNIDGTPYTFYGYLNKALEFQLLEYDVKGNAIVTPLLALVDNKIYPKKALTKEEFIVMAYIALRSNNCLETKEKDEIAINLHIKDASCSEGKNNCKNLTLDSNISTYDFEPEVISACSTGIKSYVWRFYNSTTGEKIIEYKDYVDNFTFPSFGQWNIYLRAIDNCGNTSETHSTISYISSVIGKIDTFEKECNLSTIGGCTKVGTEGKIGENTYDFNGVVTGGKGGETYAWKFTHKETGEIIERTGKYVNDLKFPKNGVWDIELLIVDKDGIKTKVYSIIIINVSSTIIPGISPGTPISGSSINTPTSTDTPSGSTTTGITGPSTAVLSMVGKIDIFEKECSVSTIGGCTKVGTEGKKGENTYDFNGIVTGGKGGETYTWKFTHKETGEIIERTGKYINDLKFPKNGVWDIELDIVDTEGTKTKVYSIITVDSLTGISVSIEATPISGTGPLEVDFSSLISGGSEIKEYVWDFGDGETGKGKNITHIYDEKGVYEAELTVQDIYGNYFTSTVNIYVDIIDCSMDIDNDGASDCEDKCIGVKGENINLGCPILEKKCDSNGLCPRGYTCSTSDPKLYTTEGICMIDTSSIGTTGASGDTPGKESISKNCLYDTSKDTVYGNVVCNSCPCNLSIDYNASIRKCDVLFPAITSPDSTEIYSKGKMFLVK